MDVILASTSKYRKQLLTRLGVFFEARSSEVDENKYKSDDLGPIETSKLLSKLKTDALSKKFPEALIIGSDQLVSFEDQILGKPKTSEKAFQQLQSMRGKVHELVTSVNIYTPQKVYLHTNVTRLHMKNLDDQLLKKYIETDQPFDCAGSYKLEQAGIALFSKIETEDSTAIVGLPLIFVSQVLIENNIEIFNSF